MERVMASEYKGIILKMAIVWLSIFVVLSFFAATPRVADPVSMSIIPEVPKTNEPIVATFNIANPTDRASTTGYELYVNSKLVESGVATIAPRNSTKYQYAWKNTLEIGEQVNFVLRTNSASGNFEKRVSLPAYPSQLMSSFVSMAAFSTSVMSSLISIEYFDAAFGTTNSINTGIIVSLILVGLLLFLELTQAVTANTKTPILISYRTHFSTLSSILLVIFVAMVITKVVMIMTV